MDITSNALLRHKTIDACLRDKTRKYTLLDLINACTAAIKEKKGDKNKSRYCVSTRTVQLDLQFMRDKSKGYGAPIVVYDHKYYKYKDNSFTLEKAQIKKENLSALAELVDTLKEYSKFDQLESIRNLVTLLEEDIHSRIEKKDLVSQSESRKNALGLEYYSIIQDAILTKKVLCIGYYSSRSQNIIPIIFYPFFLKEYNGRWYALGYKDGLNGVYKLPLDRIRDYSYSILPFPDEYSFNPKEYFNDIIGVTRLSGGVKQIKFNVKNKLAPYIKLNPLHHSQKLVKGEENGDMVFTIDVIPNREFYNLVYVYQPNIQIISPREIGLQANAHLLEMAEQLPDYDLDTSKKEQSKEVPVEQVRDLFSDL